MESLSWSGLSLVCRSSNCGPNTQNHSHCPQPLPFKAFKVPTQAVIHPKLSEQTASPGPEIS